MHFDQAAGEVALTGNEPSERELSDRHGQGQKTNSDESELSTKKTAKGRAFGETVESGESVAIESHAVTDRMRSDANQSK